MLVCVNGERDSIQSDSLVSLCFGGNNSPAAICCCCWLSFVPVCKFCFLFRVGRCRVRNRKGGNKERNRERQIDRHTQTKTQANLPAQREEPGQREESTKGNIT